MKSIERYELIKQGLSEGKTKSQIAREMEVTPALISQIVKKHSEKVPEVSIEEVRAAFNSAVDATAAMPE